MFLSAWIHSTFLHLISFQYLPRSMPWGWRNSWASIT